MNSGFHQGSGYHTQHLQQKKQGGSNVPIIHLYSSQEEAPNIQIVSFSWQTDFKKDKDN